jgi:hypothetical protein
MYIDAAERRTRMAKAGRNGRDVQKERHWAKTIKEAVRSGQSIREFCTRRRIKESQFYWWRRKLEELRQERALRRQGKKDSAGNDGEARFALVSDQAGEVDAGIELVLEDGRRLRIGRGVDEDTLRTVLETMDR